MRCFQLRASRIAFPILALLLPLVAAGCGSARPPGAASAAKSSPPFEYARCIRSHGVANFPDPQVTVSPGETSVRQVAPASLASTPRFKSAQHACAGILGEPGAGNSIHRGPGIAVLLAFARCLRGHGMSGFPDPTPQGQITRQMLSRAGVDLRTPVFLSAARACIGVTHGAITPAEIHAAISGPH